MGLAGLGSGGFGAAYVVAGSRDTTDVFYVQR
jgi:hypothetical protein